MNKNIRNFVKGIARNSEIFFSGLVGSVTSFLRIIVLSKCRTSLETRHYSNLKEHKSCIILANGPSLKKALDSGDVIYQDRDVFCLNLFASSDYFWKLKPRFYFLSDNAFFEDLEEERIQNQLNTLKDAFSKIDWDMYLCIPSGCANGGVLKFVSNPRVKIIRWNTTSTNGFRWFTRLMYDLFLGMPRCTNISNFAIMSSILMKYNNVYLYGLDHSMFVGKFVDEDNVLCYTDSHVYDTRKTILKLPDEDIASSLSNDVSCFRSHQEINSYAMQRGCDIINCTRGSFVDAYKRKKLNQI